MLVFWKKSPDTDNLGAAYIHSRTTGKDVLFNTAQSDLCLSFFHPPVMNGMYQTMEDNLTVLNWAQKPEQIYMYLMLKMSAPGGHVIDIGCGTSPAARGAGSVYIAPITHQNGVLTKEDGVALPGQVVQMGGRILTCVDKDPVMVTNLRRIMLGTPKPVGNVTGRGSEFSLPRRGPTETSKWTGQLVSRIVIPKKWDLKKDYLLPEADPQATAWVEPWKASLRSKVTTGSTATGDGATVPVAAAAGDVGADASAAKDGKMATEAAGGTGGTASPASRHNPPRAAKAGRGSPLKDAGASPASRSSTRAAAGGGDGGVPPGGAPAAKPPRKKDTAAGPVAKKPRRATSKGGPPSAPKHTGKRGQMLVNRAMA